MRNENNRPGESPRLSEREAQAASQFQLADPSSLIEVLAATFVRRDLVVSTGMIFMQSEC
jgi:hypothetical protein